MKESSHRSERAKSRWAILRKALLKNDRGTAVDSSRDNVRDNTNSTDSSDNKNTSTLINEHSIHRFAGFQMLKRRIIPKEESQNMLISENGKSRVEDSQNIVEYEIPYSPLDSQAEKEKIIVRTLERKENGTKLSLKELMSHVHFGVDNTGNTRVWDCSNVLAFLIMGEKEIPFAEELHQAHGLEYSRNAPFVGLKDVLSLATHTKINAIKERKLLRVLELGAGMAALPSLVLAALDLKYRAEHETIIPRIHVTISDGHPHAVENNISCSQLTRQLYKCNTGSDDNGIHCHSLLWKANDIGKQECDEIMTNMSSNDSTLSKHVPFDLILVSDCTHFSDFHADLAATIGRMLRINGICLLCQPQRGATLKKFMQVLDAMNERENCPLFQVDLHERYNEEIYDRHRRLVDGKNEKYDAIIHYPLLLVLKKLREYHEDQDSCKATSFVKTRM